MALSTINADNYAELVNTIEQIGFKSFTREYNLDSVTSPFTTHANQIFEIENDTGDQSVIDNTSSCALGGSTMTSGGIFSGALDFNLQYIFDDCEEEAGKAAGTASFNDTRINNSSQKHVFDLVLTGVDIDGVDGDRVIEGSFDIEDNQQLSLEADFDVTRYVVEIPNEQSLEISGIGKYKANTFPDIQDATGATADSTLEADFVLRMTLMDGTEIDVNATTDLGLASTSDFDVGPPVAGTLEISADDNSRVVISPADSAGMVNVELTSADGLLTQDVRSWSEIVVGP